MEREYIQFVMGCQQSAASPSAVPANSAGSKDGVSKVVTGHAALGFAEAPTETSKRVQMPRPP